MKLDDKPRKKKRLLIVICVVTIFCICVAIGVALLIDKLLIDKLPVFRDVPTVTKAESTGGTFVHPPEWMDMSVTNYAIVKIGDVEEEFIRNNIDGHEKVIERIYSIELIYLYSLMDLNWDEHTKYLYIESSVDIDLGKGDIILIDTYDKEAYGYKCISLWNGEFEIPEYLKIENGMAEFNDENLDTASFLPIMFVNEIIDLRSERDTNSDIKTFPKKKMYGRVTQEEIIEYFETIKISCREWQELYSY